jgi:hypothetical protein
MNTEDKKRKHDLSSKEALTLVNMAVDREGLARLLALPTAELRRRIQAERRSALSTRDAISAISRGMCAHHMMQPQS